MYKSTFLFKRFKFEISIYILNNAFYKHENDLIYTKKKLTMYNN